MRDVSLGCGQINQKIVSLLNCSMADAEEIKLAEKTDKIPRQDLNDIVSSVVSDWCGEIRRALDFFYSTNPDDQIKQIVLSGGGSNIKEFRELLALQSSAEVKNINPFEALDTEAEHLDQAFLKQIAPQAAISMGLAVRRVDDK